MAATPPGSGSLDLGLFANDDQVGARARYAHHLRRDLALYAEGWGAYDWTERELGYGVAAGMRWRW